MYPYSTYGWNKKKVQFRESTDHYTNCLPQFGCYVFDSLHYSIFRCHCITMSTTRWPLHTALDRTDSSSLAECAKIGGILANVYYLWSVDTSLCLLFLSSPPPHYFCLHFFVESPFSSQDSSFSALV